MITNEQYCYNLPISLKFWSVTIDFNSITNCIVFNWRVLDMMNFHWFYCHENHIYFSIAVILISSVHCHNAEAHYFRLIFLPNMLADYSHGFGGKFGVQKDRQDKSAAGWDHIEKVDKHESQTGYFLQCIWQRMSAAVLCYYYGLPCDAL